LEKEQKKGKFMLYFPFFVLFCACTEGKFPGQRLPALSHFMYF